MIVSGRQRKRQGKVPNNSRCGAASTNGPQLQAPSCLMSVCVRESVCAVPQRYWPSERRRDMESGEVEERRRRDSTRSKHKRRQKARLVSIRIVKRIKNCKIKNSQSNPGLCYHSTGSGEDRQSQGSTEQDQSTWR